MATSSSPSPSWTTAAAWVILALAASLLVLRLIVVVPLLRSKAGLKKREPRRRDANETVKVAVFLGSGGHTAEMLKLVAALDTKRYNERVYYVSHGDQFSARKAAELELERVQKTLGQAGSKASSPAAGVVVKQLPRARRVHQSFVTTPLSAGISLLACVYHVLLRPLAAHWQLDRRRRGKSSKDDVFADLLLLNGPGTCVPLVLAVYVRRILGLHSPHIMYIESFARVRSLSLSAKLLKGLVDTFVVQWAEADPSAECRGWLV